MKNIKKYAAILAIAALSGFGIFSFVSAIGAQDEKSPNQKIQHEKKNSSEDMESEENEADENEADDEAGESEEGDEAEADEGAAQAELQKQADISREQAEAIALKKIPGKIVEGELDKENGRLVYDFDVQNADNEVFEVEVDAKTGEVIKAQPENEDGQGDEPDNDSN